MTSLVDRLWPSAHAEVSQQLAALRSLCNKPQWSSAELTQCYKIFHTMKSTMAMVEVPTLEQLFGQCETTLRDLGTQGAPPSAELIGLVADIAAWAAPRVDSAWQSRETPDSDPTLLARLAVVAKSAVQKTYQPE